MENRFSLFILGSGSAIPTPQRGQSSQVLLSHDKFFMIDCGEGTQRLLRMSKVKISRLNHIFISHLHGDHCFGLVGLISTLGMMHRTASLYIHSHPGLEALLRPMMSAFCSDLPYEVEFVPFSPFKSEVIFEDKSISVQMFPLKHSLPTSGFLFAEKQGERHIIKEKIDFFKIPIKDIQNIKLGADYILEDGTIIPNKVLTTPPNLSLRYAYCSDTVYNESILPYIEGVDILFHEASFLQKDLDKARQTMHSTAFQAATIAQKANAKKLVLGHFSARYSEFEEFLKEATPIFPNTILAKDLSIILP